MAGCRSITGVPNAIRFERVLTIPGRNEPPSEVRARLRPGDLLVNRIGPLGAITRRQWLHLVLPQGHAMIVLDPEDTEFGLLECRRHGTRRVPWRELRIADETVAYRLEEPQLLNLDRLNEFAFASSNITRGYSFGSWFGLNGKLTPDDPRQINTRYTCSSMVVAAYHYAGVDLLNFTCQPRRVVTPKGLVNADALPVGEMERLMERLFEELTLGIPLSRREDADPPGTVSGAPAPAKP
jgi:hypothetical protein